MSLISGNGNGNGSHGAAASFCPKTALTSRTYIQKLERSYLLAALGALRRRPHARCRPAENVLSLLPPLREEIRSVGLNRNARGNFNSGDTGKFYDAADAARRSGDRYVATRSVRRGFWFVAGSSMRRL